MPIANARMYSATPAVKEAWRQLLHWVLGQAGLDWEVLDYDAPAPLSALWARDDLGLALMCGLPFLQRVPRPLLLAAAVPAAPRYRDRPVYFTDIVVRAASSHQCLEDTFGGVLGYTLADSMSGGVALRNHLAPYRVSHAGPLYREAVGNLINARGVIEALAAGRIDVGPLDSYYHDLLRRDAPAFARQVRSITSTDAMPMPPFVTTSALDDEWVRRLRAALLAVAGARELGAARERLLLKGFTVCDASDYDVLAAIADSPLPTFKDLLI